jgi:hypothetical protein
VKLLNWLDNKSGDYADSDDYKLSVSGLIKLLELCGLYEWSCFGRCSFKYVEVALRNKFVVK